MKKIIFSLLLALSAFAIEPSVTPQWLNKHIDDVNLRIIEVSTSDSYSREHIKNAQNTDIGQWRIKEGTFFVVRPNAVIEKEIQRLGIDEKSEVVLYAPISTPKDLLKASYIFWALNYHGITNVAILDGGLNQWKKESLPLSNTQTTAHTSNYKVKINKALLADKAYVMQHLHKIPMIDARPSDNYLGITPTDTVQRDGHIQGAMSYSWNYSINPEYLLKDTKKLAKLFAEGYNLDKNKEVLVYCTGGLETSYNYYILSGVLGYKNVRLYDASMKEWGNSDETPMSIYKYEVFTK
ncbi:MAG: rhodanese-like domain-containing protein [Sulfurimonas sp.]|nr:rhodanese-like domain-containing protein [Sulfurimonas sp.]